MKAYYKDETINSITEETTREELSKLGIKNTIRGSVITKLTLRQP